MYCDKHKDERWSTGSKRQTYFSLIKPTKPNNKMKTTTTTLFTAALCGALSLATATDTRAATVVVTPDDVNRLNEYAGEFGGSNLQNVPESYFSTNIATFAPNPGGNDQYTIVTTLQSSFLSSLNTSLNGGNSLAEWQAYQINSATLTVGEVGGTDENRYELASRAHVMTTSYDIGDASWLNSDASAGGGWTGGSSIAQTGDIDWESAVQATGVVGTDITTFELTSYVVGVMVGTYSGAGEGLFFEVDVSNGILARTGPDNVEWTLDAQIITVPEPSSTTLLGLGGLALVLRRKRS